ncbi:MAG: DUF2161 family putative PD-(D/E)XK-type phosphodiesterase [Robiginitomaculum sp.]
MAKKRPKETELYGPVKALLEAQGYQVKGEIGAADVVAVRDGDDPVIVELKTTFSLALYHQAIKRQSMTDAVYIAVPRQKGKTAIAAIRKNKMLCRRLGLGLITVRLSDSRVDVHMDPAPFTPRKIRKRTTKLLREFETRQGDPNMGGAAGAVMTSYRQGALRCAKVLHENGACKASEVARLAGAPKAGVTMARNHYGWFERVERGIYGLTPQGAKALSEFADEIAAMEASP